MLIVDVNNNIIIITTTIIIIILYTITYVKSSVIRKSNSLYWVIDSSFENNICIFNFITSSLFVLIEQVFILVLVVEALGLAVLVVVLREVEVDMIL